MEYDSKLTDIIASLPEISGGFLYSPEKGVYSNQTAGLADDFSLQQISIKFAKIISMMSAHFQDTSAIRVFFKDLVLCGTEIENNQWLFLLHKPSLSPGMIRMTVQIALNSVQDEPTQIIANQTEAPQDISTSVSNETIVDVPSEDVIDTLLAPGSELREPLLHIQSLLAEYIGPVAELVLQDSVEEWALTSSPSLDSFPKLISMMEEEIDDEDDRKEFSEKLQSMKEV